ESKSPASAGLFFCALPVSSQERAGEWPAPETSKICVTGPRIPDKAEGRILGAASHPTESRVRSAYPGYSARSPDKAKGRIRDFPAWVVTQAVHSLPSTESVRLRYCLLNHWRNFDTSQEHPAVVPCPTASGM